MKAINLNGTWRIKSVTGSDWIDANVPGTVFGALLDAGKAEDPYYRDNETKVVPLFDEDYEYIREFSVSREALAHDRVLLRCEGLDTVAAISVNGNKLAETNNMHRTYRFDVKGILNEGLNTIQIIFRSPAAFIKEMAASHTPKGVMGGRGIEYIRKVQCMFGWDWGLSLPDSGIWRDIYIECFDAAEIYDVQILQHHNQGGVTLDISTDCSVWGNNLTVEVKCISPGGEIFSEANPLTAGKNHTSFKISNLQLWWPNGFGSQPLYQVNVRLLDGIKELDARCLRIGLRTIHLRRERDSIGKSYEFVVNGKAVFMMGSNLVIEDALLGRRSRERTEKMVKSCAAANFNCIRVWGGANYPEDYFYDLCDEYGIILYHDLMFACFFYPADEEFLKNVREEISDNIKRVRHHACIGLWCGNNEIEMLMQTAVSEGAAFQELRDLLHMKILGGALKEQILQEYQTLFHEELQTLAAEYDPQTDYIHSSPVIPDPEDVSNLISIFRGSTTTDSHYYLAYDNVSPYPTFRQKHFRFVSEMGFQSYPSIKTIRTFTLLEDRKPDSVVMLQHQKCRNGNQIIESYIQQDYTVPEDFDLYVYASQTMAGEIQRYEIEHLRRDAGCMGVITWQLNDCWPAVSWAGLDYYGRWKAQQYYTKRFFTPVLISACDEGTKVDLWVSNHSLQDVEGTVTWKLMDNRSNVIEKDTLPVKIKAGNVFEAVKLDFSGKVENTGEHYVEFSFIVGGETVSGGTALFVKPKDFHFIDPKINVEVLEEENQFIITLESSAFAKSVALDLNEADCIFSDNYFDLSADRKKIITADKSSFSGEITLQEFKKTLNIVSVFDIR
jgi:beta-mannosidase